MNYNHLHCFHTIATEGSLKLAAKKLHVTQPTLSEQLRQLEDYFGGKLFDRQGRRLQINERGRQALSYTLRIFELGAELESRLRSGQQNFQEKLKIGITPSLSTSLALKALQPILKRPDFFPSIQELPLDQALETLQSRKVDLVLSDQKLSRQPQSCQTIALQRSSYFVVAAKSKANKATSLKNLAKKLPYMAYTETSSLRYKVDSYFHRQRIDAEIFGETNESHFMRLATEQGLCFSILPQEVVRESIKGGKLSKITVVEGISSTTYMIYRRGDSRSRLQSVLALLKPKK